MELIGEAFNITNQKNWTNFTGNQRAGDVRPADAVARSPGRCSWACASTSDELEGPGATASGPTQ